MLTEADFERIVNHTIKIEGGYVDDPKDPGGATKYGISLRFLTHEALKCCKGMIIDKDFIKNLNIPLTIEIYREAFWNRFKYYDINNAVIAAKIFDMAVNMGPSQAHKLAQRAASSLLNESLVIDGILGQKSIAAINYLFEIVAEKKYIEALRAACVNFYNSLVLRKRADAKFLKGWLSRANDTVVP